MLNAGKGDPGSGFYGHREGYNVLYGDIHVSWYGDPRGKFAWWPECRVAGKSSGYSGASQCGASTTSTNLTWWKRLRPDAREGDDRVIVADGAEYRVNLNRNCSAYAWHTFDLSQDLDADAPGDGAGE